MKINGLQNFSAEIAKLSGEGKNMCKYALYGGAEAVADAIKENISSIPTSAHHYVTQKAVGYKSPPSVEKVNVTDELKAELSNSLGIAKFTVGGTIETVIGFAGYSSIVTEKYPSGLPLQMIARSIESGSSVRNKHAFVRPAVNKSKSKAKDAMNKRAEEFIARFKL